MKTFIRVAEIWLPAQDGSTLEFGGGLYGRAPGFGTVSRQMCFGRGEGLPGRAWDEARPLLLTQLEGSYFLRTRAARAAGLRCAMALPIFVGDVFKAVVVLLCGDHDAHAGAIELWHNDSRIAADMTLIDGYYGTTGEGLHQLSQDTYLPRGAGLPGLAWQRGASVFVGDLAASPQFLRQGDAAAAGLTHGMAFPCTTRTHVTYVLTLLSAAQTPVAQRIESWAAGTTPGTLLRTGGHCETEGPLGHGRETVSLAGDGAVASAFRTGVPAVSEPARTLSGPVGATAGTLGCDALIAIPVIAEGAVSEVVVMYF